MFKNNKYQVSCHKCVNHHDWDKDCEGNYIPRDNITKTFQHSSNTYGDKEIKPKMNSLNIIQQMLLLQKDLNKYIEILLELEEQDVKS